LSGAIRYKAAIPETKNWRSILGGYQSHFWWARFALLGSGLLTSLAMSIRGYWVGYWVALPIAWAAVRLGKRWVALLLAYGCDAGSFWGESGKHGLFCSMALRQVVLGS
jgi:hypothetical protein